MINKLSSLYANTKVYTRKPRHTSDLVTVPEDATPDAYARSVQTQEYDVLIRWEWTRAQIDARLTLAAIQIIKLQTRSRDKREFDSLELFWESVAAACRQRLAELKRRSDA